MTSGSSGMRARHVVGLALGLALVVGVGTLVVRRLMEPGDGAVAASGADRAVPVEVAPVERGAIELRRTFTGTLRASAVVSVAPKVSGRLASVLADVSDEVARGEVIATLDDDEFRQAVMQAEAELEVARAEVLQAESAAEIDRRECELMEQMSERGVATPFELERKLAEARASEAAVRAAESRVLRAAAALESARIRLGYTRVAATWSDDDTRRVVAERWVEPGDTVAANAPLLTVVSLDPVEAVIFATERDYALLRAGQEVSVTTDAYPGRSWAGRVSRLSPVFREGSRQAEVEILASNPDGSLKPGMFVRIGAVLDRREGVTIVPEGAVTRRDGRDVLFVVDEGADAVRMVEVELGVSDGGRVEVLTPGLGGRVVTLGQQLVSDGSRVVATEAGVLP